MTQTRSKRVRERLDPAIRRGRLLDAAARIVTRSGLTGISMEGVARAAGVSKGLVYNYFPTCHAMLCDLLRRELDAIWRKQVEAVQGVDDFVGIARLSTRQYLQHVAEHGELLRPLLADPTLAAQMGTERATGRASTVRFFAKRMARDYSIPMEPALVACDLLLDLGAAASRRMMETGESPTYLEDLCVTMVEGSARAVARRYKPPAPAGEQRSVANNGLRNSRGRATRAQPRNR
jgi:TetR/AcrR family transcriptional regulator, fatty acid biosynthesis regulator